jgi:hypothetical protein
MHPTLSHFDAVDIPDCLAESSQEAPGDATFSTSERPVAVK